MCFEQFFIKSAPVFQALFAGVLLLFAIFQWMLNRKIDRSNKLMSFWDGYANMSDSRRSFWENLERVYGSVDFAKEIGRDQRLQTPLHSQIREDGFPREFKPSKEKNLPKFVRESERNGIWGDLVTWHLAKFVYLYEKSLPPNKMASKRAFDFVEFMRNIDKARSELAYFWNKWAGLLDFREYPQPDLKELVMLTWLEFALILEKEGVDKDEKVGKRDLFKLTFDLTKRAVWKPFKDSSD